MINEEPPYYRQPKAKKKKIYKSDQQPKSKEEQLSLHDIKKKENELKEKLEQEKLEKEKLEREKLEQEKLEIKNEEKEDCSDDGKEKNEITCPTYNNKDCLNQNKDEYIIENLPIIDIKTCNNDQIINSSKNYSVDNELLNKKIYEQINTNQNLLIGEQQKEYNNCFYKTNRNLSEEELKKLIYDYFNECQLDDITTLIHCNRIYFEKTFSIILNIGILNCITYPFLNKLIVAIIGASINFFDLDKINMIYYSLKDNIIQHSEDNYSYYVIIALIEAFYSINTFFKGIIENGEFENIIKENEEKINNIYLELKKKDLIEIFKHRNATFVIQYLIDKLNKENQEEIFDCVLQNFNDLINDKIGIFALRKILLIIPGNSKKCNELTKLIIENKYFQEILTDKTGNFLIKLILQKTKNKFFELIFLKIKDSVSILAKNKYASFVLEELINVANKKQLKEINKEFKDCKEILLKDNFGKYVMQTLNKKRYIIEHFS